MSNEKFSYWNNKGKYQDVHDVLWAELVPSSGEAESVHGELVRCLGRLWYEFCNNGNCNARFDSRRIDEYYGDMLMFINDNVPNISNEVDKIQRIILSSTSFGEAQYEAYNNLSNKTLEFIIKERAIDLDEFKTKANEIMVIDAKGSIESAEYTVIELEIEIEVLTRKKVGSVEIDKVKKRLDYYLKLISDKQAKIVDLEKQLKIVAQ